MQVKLVPRQVLFGTRDVYEVRAWARGWDESLDDIFSGDDERRSRGTALLADLTATPPSAVREIAAECTNPTEFLDRLAALWAKAALTSPSAYKLYPLPDGATLVEPPFNSEAVRRYLADWKRREGCFEAFVTADARTLA